MTFRPFTEFTLISATLIWLPSTSDLGHQLTGNHSYASHTDHILHSCTFSWNTQTRSKERNVLSNHTLSCYEYTASAVDSILGTGGMILTGENRSTRRNPWPCATFSTTNPTCTGLGSNPGLHSNSKRCRMRATRTRTILLHWFPTQFRKSDTDMN
jgi:hypothetical protein